MHLRTIAKKRPALAEEFRDSLYAIGGALGFLIVVLDTIEMAKGILLPD